MKKSIKKSVLVLCVFAALAISLSSCNRGMGCPNNFSLEQGMMQIIQPDMPTID